MANFLRCVGGRLINLDNVTMIDISGRPEDNEDGETAIIAQMVDGTVCVLEDFDPGQEVQPKDAYEALDYYADLLEAANRPWPAGSLVRNINDKQRIEKANAKYVADKPLPPPRIIIHNINGVVEYVSCPDLDVTALEIALRDDEQDHVQSVPQDGISELEFQGRYAGIIALYDQSGGYLTFTHHEWTDIITDDLNTMVEDDQEIVNYINGALVEAQGDDEKIAIHFEPNAYLRVQYGAQCLNPITITQKGA